MDLVGGGSVINGAYPVMCPVSPVTCQVSNVTCNFYYKYFLFCLLFGLIGGFSRWRICYQLGLPLSSFNPNQNKPRSCKTCKGRGRGDTCPCNMYQGLWNFFLNTKLHFCDFECWIFSCVLFGGFCILLFVMRFICINNFTQFVNHLCIFQQHKIWIYTNCLYLKLTLITHQLLSPLNILIP